MNSSTNAPENAGQKPKRLVDLLQASANYLAEKGVAESRLVSEWLFSHVLGCRRLELYLRFDEILGEAQLAVLREGLRRLAAGVPLQYVLGEAEFMGRRLAVDNRALIPRPETERLVETVLACEALWRRPSPAIMDVGTGTGCIVISLALARPQGVYLAVDISQAALELARENAAEHLPAEKVRFEACDVLNGASHHGLLDAIVANPPYIPTAACERLPRHIRDHEPVLALDGGPDGLAFIRRLVGQAPTALKPEGFLFMEIGCEQGREVVALMQARGFEGVRVEQDLGGRDRVAWGRKP